MHKSFCLAPIAGLALATAASANIINLSDLSSDENVDPADLSATLDFSVLGNQLSVTVTNLAANYVLSEFLFNGPDGVTLSFNGGVNGWSFLTNATVDDFGTFDFAMNGPIDALDPDKIAFNESVKFSFTILTGTPTKEDFTTLFSEGGIPAIGAGKFRQEGGFFVIGAAIPGPASLALLGVAGLFGRLGRRRRR